MNDQQPVTWRLEADGPARRLAEKVLAAADEYHRARVDQDTTDTPRWNVRAIAANHEEYRDDPDTAAAFLDHLAERLTLDDVRALRLAGEAAVAATPRAIKAARDRGMKPPRIAAELGLTPSRVYQVVREQAAQEDAATVGEYQLSTTGGHEWHRETPTAGRRCRRCDLPHSQWSGERCTGSNDQ